MRDIPFVLCKPGVLAVDSIKSNAKIETQRNGVATRRSSEYRVIVGPFFLLRLPVSENRCSGFEGNSQSHAGLAARMRHFPAGNRVSLAL